MPQITFVMFPAPTTCSLHSGRQYKGLFRPPSPPSFRENDKQPNLQHQPRSFSISLYFLVLGLNVYNLWDGRTIVLCKKCLFDQIQIPINQEVENIQRVNKEGTMVEVKQYGKLQQYWKYFFRSVLSSVLCINTVLTVSRDKYRLKILEICFAYST